MAAIEFALTMLLLVLIVFGIVSYGAMFWAQQKLSNLAGEGARYALVLSMQGGSGASGAAPICHYIDALAANDALLQAPVCSSITCTPSGCPWNGGASPAPAGTAAQYATITLNYNLKNLPLAGLVGQLAGFFSAEKSDWVPTKLTASSTVRLATD